MIQCGVGVNQVCVVIIIGSWSDGSVWTVLRVVVCCNVWEEKVMSG